MKNLSFFLLAAFALLVASCKNGESTAKTNNSDNNTPPPAAASKTHARKALRTERDSAGTASVEVYNFAAFEDFLKAPNKDTLYVLNFWATWCAPCVAELPHFVHVAEKNKNLPIKVILVSLDFEKQIKARLLPFLQKNKLPFEVISLVEPDANAWIDKISTTWDGSIPATLFYKGDKRQFLPQSFEESELDSVVRSFF